MQGCSNIGEAQSIVVIVKRLVAAGVKAKEIGQILMLLFSFWAVRSCKIDNLYMLHLEAMPGTSYLPPPLVQFCSQDNHDINSTPSVKFMKANHEYAGVICFFRAQVAVSQGIIG